MRLEIERARPAQNPLVPQKPRNLHTQVAAKALRCFCVSFGRSAAETRFLAGHCATLPEGTLSGY